MKDALERINLAEFASKVADRMSLNSKKTSVEEYKTVYIEDDILFNMIEELSTYRSMKEDIMRTISNSRDREEIKILEEHLERVKDYICKLQDDIDSRRKVENIKRENYVDKAVDKKIWDRNFLIALGLVGVGAIALCSKDGRKIILDGMKSLDGPS